MFESDAWYKPEDPRRAGDDRRRFGLPERRYCKQCTEDECKVPISCVSCYRQRWFFIVAQPVLQRGNAHQNPANRLQGEDGIVQNHGG